MRKRIMVMLNAVFTSKLLPRVMASLNFGVAIASLLLPHRGDPIPWLAAGWAWVYASSCLRCKHLEAGIVRIAHLARQARVSLEADCLNK